MEHLFLDALAAAGIPPTHPLVLDGQLRRYNVAGDKKGKRNGWYRYVRVRDGFAWATFGCNKRGISDKWVSLGKHKITKYDTGLMKKRQAEQKKEQEALQAKVSLKANAIWTRLKTPANNDYAARKGIGLYNVRELHNSLVVPLYCNNYIVSLQFISADGTKRFLTGGQSLGAYGCITDIGDVIYICEGYATAASVYEATGQAVVIAFYAANIVPVAKAIREIFPNKKIIIAADNDQWTDHPIKNPGLSAALEAADKIGARVVYPDFEYTDAQKGTDWNDWHKKCGIESLRTELLGLPKPQTQMAIADKDLWKKSLLEGTDFRPGFPMFDGKSKQNAYLFIRNHDACAGVFAFNEFSNEIMIMKCPPWENESTFTPRQIKDSDASMLVNTLECLGIKTNKMLAYDFIDHIAWQNRINPPRDYFRRLQWDGRPRIDKWLTAYLGAKKQNPEYLRLIGSKWIMAVVARSFNPGCKFDNVLILEGAEGIKKTTAFEVLSTFEGENFFLEFSGDVTRVDSINLMQGKMIVEMAELASIRKSEVEDMKAFISNKIDEFRPSYGHFKIKRPRFFVLGASTNKVGQEYLDKQDGARRVWPVECGNEIDFDALKRDQPQLYAEAVARYMGGERIWLEGDEVDLARLEQSHRQAQDGWEEKVFDFLIGKIDVSAVKVFEGIGMATKDMSNKSIGRVKECLRALGWIEYRPNGEYGRERRWKRR